MDKQEEGVTDGRQVLKPSDWTSPGLASLCWTHPGTGLDDKGRLLVQQATLVGVLLKAYYYYVMRL